MRMRWFCGFRLCNGPHSLAFGAPPPPLKSDKVARSWRRLGGLSDAIHVRRDILFGYQPLAPARKQDKGVAGDAGLDCGSNLANVDVWQPRSGSDCGQSLAAPRLRRLKVLIR